MTAGYLRNLCAHQGVRIKFLRNVSSVEWVEIKIKLTRVKVKIRVKNKKIVVSENRLEG